MLSNTAPHTVPDPTFPLFHCSNTLSIANFKHYFCLSQFGVNVWLEWLFAALSANRSVPFDSSVLLIHVINGQSIRELYRRTLSKQLANVLPIMQLCCRWSSTALVVICRQRSPTQTQMQFETTRSVCLVNWAERSSISKALPSHVCWQLAAKRLQFSNELTIGWLSVALMNKAMPLIVFFVFDCFHAITGVTYGRAAQQPNSITVWISTAVLIIEKVFTFALVWDQLVVLVCIGLNWLPKQNSLSIKRRPVRQR